MSFTDEVKQELARVVADDEAERAELAALLRYGGALVVGGGGRGRAFELSTVSGATARRAFTLLHRRSGTTPDLRVRAPGGVNRRRTYEVRLDAPVDELGRDLGLLDADGRPTVPTPHVGAAAAPTARGAFLAAGSISAPDRPPHLEVVAHRRDAAEALAATLETLVQGRVSVVGDDDRPRVTVKSGATIGDVLTAVGATGAFLRWDERRLRRQVRSEATRLANADAANLRRSIEAASGQVRAVERVLEALGWDELDEDLRAVALARLASPDASLADLGQLTDPPMSKTAVHRRLRRLEALADGLSRPGS